MKLQVSVLSGHRRGSRFVSGASVISVGRLPSCDIPFDPDHDLDVSGQHARLEMKGRGWYVVDNDSRNGTLVNGHVITGETRLGDTDIVQFGADGPRVEIRLVPSGTPDAREIVTAPDDGATQPLSSADATAKISPTPASAAPPPRKKSNTEQLRAEVRSQVRGLRVITGVSIAAVIIVAVAFLMADKRRRDAAAAETASLEARVDSVMDAAARSQAHIATLEGQRAGLETALENSRTEVRRLSQQLASARQQGNSAEVARLTRELQDATVTLSGQTAAATVDWRSVHSANNNAVVMVFVDFGNGEQNSGSGFVISRDGSIVTNRHVVSGPDGNRRPVRMGVKFANSSQFWPAQIQRISPSADLALIKASRTDGTPIPRISATAEVAGPGTNVAVGQPIAMIGFPHGDALPMDADENGVIARTSLTAGNISKVQEDRIQIHGYGAEGASGSPIFDLTGKVIAVLYGGEPGTGGRIVYAVPAADVRELLAN